MKLIITDFQTDPNNNYCERIEIERTFTNYRIAPYDIIHSLDYQNELGYVTISLSKTLRIIEISES